MGKGLVCVVCRVPLTTPPHADSPIFSFSLYQFAIHVSSIVLH